MVSSVGAAYINYKILWIAQWQKEAVGVMKKTRWCIEFKSLKPLGMAISNSQRSVVMETHTGNSEPARGSVYSLPSAAGKNCRFDMTIL